MGASAITVSKLGTNPKVFARFSEPRALPGRRSLVCERRISSETFSLGTNNSPSYDFAATKHWVTLALFVSRCQD